VGIPEETRYWISYCQKEKKIKDEEEEDDEDEDWEKTTPKVRVNRREDGREDGRLYGKIPFDLFLTSSEKTIPLGELSTISVPQATSERLHKQIGHVSYL